MRRIWMPFYITGEWLLLGLVLLTVLFIQAMYMANVVLIDMPWEETITLSDSALKTFLGFIGVGGLLFVYIHYLAGGRMYRLIKEWAWGFVIVINFFGSALWLTLSLISGNGDMIALISSTVISLILGVQLALRYNKDKLAES
ncbi:hypothetical protein LCM20_06335 [Halobacillus litoralis]|uniref:hypothetical protein n=1 Tax=Halobacillus litoralis TaxID=45668 RepID=UPI001CD47B1E|nr:hypothetical protein [Halobacillus litoralis]MCA0970198.1 hypothetical protein [Halobacillus litoralis]